LRTRIAVIGSGISGLVSAYLLSKRYEVTLFEANDYLGGHTHTHDIIFQENPYAIDTGFIVFNKKTYPNFCRLIEKFDIGIQKSEMSFSFRSDKMGLEYSGKSFNSLFSDRRNFLKPAFYKMVKDISRFNKEAKTFLTNMRHDVSVGEFIKQNKYRNWFTEGYFIPMTAAIWSAKPSEIYATSVSFILNFMENHGLLDIYQRPQWYIIAGGSKNYIQPLVQDFKHNILLNSKVNQICRRDSKIVLKVDNTEAQFDAVMIATHSDQALSLLEQPSADEARILSAIAYQENDVVLHYDTNLLPRARRAWASWNYADTTSELTSLTYYMNKLQNISAPVDFCVSLNQAERIQLEKIIKRFRYSHPCFNQAAIKAQSEHHLINGKDGVYYCGAYWKYGFHEDGVTSALDACKSLGVEW
jgi:predicted NAD/FAD-binding protein